MTDDDSSSKLWFGGCDKSRISPSDIVIKHQGLLMLKTSSLLLICILAVAGTCYSIEEDDLFWAPINVDCTDPNCITCNQTQPDNCFECKDKFYVKELKCVACSTIDAHCDLCNQKAQCTHCESGWKLDDNKQCVKNDCPISDCDECDFTTDPVTCKTCHEGFYPANAKAACKECNSAISGCSICTGDDTTVTCGTCRTGLILKQNMCKSCDQWVLDCQECDDSGQTVTCKTCLRGYYLNDDKSSCLSCSDQVKNCLECSAPATAGGKPVCKACVNRFVLSDNTCTECEILVPNCQTCDNSTSPVSCKKCTEKYFVNNSMCTLCETSFPNCEECGEVASTPTSLVGFYLEEVRCSRCKTDYFLDDSVCKDCSTLIASCLECDGVQKTCTKCQDTFVRSIDSKECKTCASEVGECHTCTRVDKVICENCNKDYFLLNNQCKTCGSIIADCNECEQELNKVTCKSCGNDRKLSDDKLECVESKSNTAIIVVSVIVGVVVLAGAGFAIFKCMKKRRASPLADEDDYEKM